MAVAAETQIETEDFLFWELQLEQPTGLEPCGDFQVWEAEIERPPEAEIYGRSLSTIRRLGAFMINAVSRQEAIESPEAAQAKVEFYTSVEEGAGTDMELGGGLEVRDFDVRQVQDGRVMAKAKVAVSAMTEAGLVCAEETARKDRRFHPQLVRSHWDHQNALFVDKMVRGETDYNTRMAISPFPEEAAAQSGDDYWQNIGYVPHLKRGFVQLYHVTSEGTLLAGSLSFDGSSKDRLRKVFSQMGVDIPAGEITDNWLKYAITRNLSEADAKALATAVADASAAPEYKKNTNTVDITRKYKPMMERAFNESYVHLCESSVRGYQTAGARKLIYQLAANAHHYNARYAQALFNMQANPGQFTDDDTAVLHELLVYSTVEMMRALHLQNDAQFTGSARKDYDNGNFSIAHLQTADPSAFQNMLSDFGATGAKNNRTISACGRAISPGGGDPANSPQTAFGGLDKISLGDDDTLGSRWFTCSKGHTNYRMVANYEEPFCKMCWRDVSCKAPAPAKPKKQSKQRSFFGANKSYENGPKQKLGKLASLA